MSRTLYVRRRSESGEYEILELIDGDKPLPGETVYYNCRVCGQRVVAGFGEPTRLHRDTRDGCCFQHMPRDNRLKAEPRTDITLDITRDGGL